MFRNRKNIIICTKYLNFILILYDLMLFWMKFKVINKIKEKKLNLRFVDLNLAQRQERRKLAPLLIALA